MSALASRTARMVLVLLALWLVLSVHPDTGEAFFTASNLSNLTAQVAEIVILGAGMTLVIILGGIDLSVGAGMALCGVVAAKLQIDGQQPAVLAVLAALLTGALLGAWHGLLIARLRVPPFIATLGGFLAYRGLALVLSDARGLSPMGRDFALISARLPARLSTLLLIGALAAGVGALLGRRRRRQALGLPAAAPTLLAAQLAGLLMICGSLALIYKDGMPVPVLLAAAAALVGDLLLRRARLGRYALAIGGNALAARLSGVPVARTTALVYLLTGVLTAVAGLVLCARTNGVTPGSAGQMRELHVISAVVIGGTSLRGGSGTMAGTVVGALIFGTLSNGMNLLNVNSNWQLILTGGILLGASLIDSYSNREGSP